MSEILEEQQFDDDLEQEARDMLSFERPNDDEIRFILASVVDFLEDLPLTGETLLHAGQLLRDVEDLQGRLL